MRCANEKCVNNPLNSICAIVVNLDGDFACDENCKQEHEKQKNVFLENVGNDEWYKKWLKQ